MFEKHGYFFRYSAFLQDIVSLFGVDALEFVVMDKEKNFSTRLGYKPLIGPLADTSLLLMDFDEHRSHRHTLNPAFKTAVMKAYIKSMHSTFSQQTDIWKQQNSFQFYPAAKQLTLDVATGVFIGIEDKAQKAKVNTALTHMLASLISVVRLPIPGTRHYKGIKGRDYIKNMLLQQIPERKKTKGTDVFSRLCHEKNEDGVNLTDDEIIGHLMTFWIAGHDTLASALTTLTYQLGKNPEWQHKLRAEVNELELDGRQPTMQELGKLTLCDYAFKEALRLVPPALNTPRQTLREISFNGYRIPKGVQVFTSVYGVHHDETYWPEPEKFDPMRFAPENTPKDRHKFAWAPFGGGAHKCIGMVFAQLQAKIYLLNVLSHFEIVFPENYEIQIQWLPTPRPKDGLPVTFKPLAKN